MADREILRSLKKRYPGKDAEPGDYARYARSCWDEQEDKLSPLHNTWIQNLLFLSNRQWWKLNKLGLWTPEVVPSWRKQPTSNLCLAFFKTFLAKVTKNRPAWQVIPASTDPKEIQAAELADEVLEAKWLELNLGKVFRRAVAWTIATGNAFLYPYWNEEGGKIVPYMIEREVPKYDEDGQIVGTDIALVPADENGDPILDENGLPDLEAEPLMVPEGEIGLKVYSPFQVRVNADAETDEDVRCLLIAEAMTLEEIADRWPDKAHLVTAEDVGRLEDYDRMLAGVIGQGEMAITSAGDQRDDEVPKAIIIHYHEKPSREYPNGRYWVSARDVELEEPQDLPDGIFPLIHMRDLEVPGRFYAMSTLESIVGLNREYNEVNQQVLEHHALMTKGKWIAPRGSGITAGNITSQPGEVLTPNPGFEIKQVDIKPLPPAVYQERERVLADFEIVSGIRKVSMGQNPPGVTAGVAILQLQEADDTDLGPFLAMLEECVASVARAFLRIIRERYDTERLIYVPGENRRYLVRAFRGSDLEGAVDVVPVAESSFPWSKTAKQAMILDMLQRAPQVFMDPDTGQLDVQKLARLLPVGGLDSLAQGQDIDVQEAMREEEMFETLGIESNELPMVEWWQNHHIHYNQHVRVLKSAKFREWPRRNQELFKLHVMQHDQMRAQAMAAGTASPAGQQMVAAAQQAAGPPTGAPVAGTAGEVEAPPGVTPQVAQDLDTEALEEVLSSLPLT